MAIIQFTKKYSTPEFALLNMYPDQMVSDKEKQTDDWWKCNMDYFYNVAIQQYTRNKEKLVRNYELVKGILRPSDFYMEDNHLQSFTETLLQQEELPAYVKHYSILTPPLNTLKGELANRPDNVYVKAFDDDSKSEEQQFRTEVLNDYIFQNAKTSIINLLARRGEEVEDEQVAQLTAERVEEYMTSYSSLAERWGANILEYQKMKFNLKEKSEEGFGDLLISGREFFHIYEDNTELGFNVENVNPKNVWYIQTPDNQYISDPLDKNTGAYAAGTIEVMELSEIINKYNLTEEEVKRLREMSQQAYLLNDKESPLVNGSARTGFESIDYATYDPLVLQYRQVVESELQLNRDDLGDFLGITNNIGVFGNKYLVVTSYWCSKKKIGKLTYIDIEGNEVITYVDDNYKKNSHPQEVSLEWGWINQWYKGAKIGLDIYYVEPFELLDYCPIIGVLYESKNIPEPVSLVDQMKPFQMLYNIAMNQLFRLLEKDLGVVFLTSKRHVPVPKDGDYQDALEMWETEAREKGLIFIDDSPENLKAPSSFNQHTRVDLSRAAEIQARYNLAVEMRNECWRLVGLSEQRLGSTSATETATGINTALSQSYAQTEPWFAKHEYLINKVYQALLDAALYKQSQQEESILSGISSEGANAFVRVNGSDLKLRQLGVFVTSRSEDARSYQEIKQLAQAMLQNGAHPYDIVQLYSTKSIRQMKDIFRRLKQKQEQFQQEAQQLEQQKLQQSQEQFAQQQEMLQLQYEKQQAFEAYQKDADRTSKERIAYMAASAKGSPDTSPSSIEISRLAQEEQNAYSTYQLKLQELTQKQQQVLTQHQLDAQRLEVDKEKLKVAREKIVSDEKVASINKNKFDTKPKKK